MTPKNCFKPAWIAAFFFTTLAVRAADDPDTGHRVIRLSREPGSLSFYFNVNAYTPQGDKMVITTPTGISTINLKTQAIDSVVQGKVKTIMVGHKSGQIYYVKDGTVYAANLDTHVSREIAKVPPNGSVSSVNADETLLAGTTIIGTSAEPLAWGNSTEKAPDGHVWTYAEQKEIAINKRLVQRLPMTLFTLNTKTGEVKTLLHSTDWLNHLQFSPTDPKLLMFCHEGNWHLTDRIWTIHTDGTGLTLIHHRTMDMEIDGHEFWSADGKTIWYDLQTPRGIDFWVAGYDVATGARTWYHLQQNEWSVHFNVSPDGTLFAGDGGDSEMTARAPDGKWIYLFRPQFVPDVAGLSVPNAKDLIKPGFFQSERLVNMSKHDYKLEPNVSFTPDMKWIIFRSNMFGPSQVFAVEVAKAK
jgi:oligogalacturonide lyase